MLKFSNLLMNIIFLILLNITTLIKSNKDSNTNFISNSNLENKFLEERAKEEANLSKNINSKYGNDNNLYNMITDFKKNLFQENTLEDFFINNEFYIKNQTSYLDIKDIKKKFENIFLQTNKNVNYESFFNSTKYTWETISSNGDIPKETKGFSMVLSGTTLIIFGGRDLNDKYYNEMYFFDLQQKSWTKILAKGLIPTPRAFHSAIIRGTTMWIFGGSSDTGYLNDLYSFDLETKIWEKHTFGGKEPLKRSGHGAALSENSKIYIFGGYVGNDYVNDIFVIDILAKKFEKPLPAGYAPRGRENVFMTIIGQNIYIYGGHSSNEVFNDLYKLNKLTYIWEKIKITKGFIPPKLIGVAGARVGKKIYISGGCDYDSKICNKDTFILNTKVSNKRWEKLSDIKPDLLSKNTLVNKSYFSIDFFKGSLVTFGGCEMNKKCFSFLNQINLGNPCPEYCSGNGSCENKIGCKCKPNFILNDCSNRAICDENCNNNGICGSNLKCNCFPGWGGKTCSNIINCAKNCTSIDSGVCQSDTSCKCNTGFGGIDCSINDNIKKIDPIAQLIAKNDLANKKQAENIKKNLDIDLKAKKIECKNNCTNHGTCELLLKKCKCYQGYSGDDCSIKPVVVKELPKQNRKFEVNQEQVIEKVEPKEIVYSLNNTIFRKTNDCKDKCNNKGNCLNNICFCKQGFTGETCEKEYKDILKAGFKFTDTIKYLIMAAGGGLVLGIIFSCLSS